jgi:phage gp36-like protein
MSYCTLQDLIDEFTEAELIQLTDEAGAGVVDTVTVDKAIARADRTINRYLAGRNELPLADDEVVDLACDIARYYLYADQVPAHVQKRFDDAVKALEKMAARKIAVVDTAGTEATESAAAPEMESSVSVFGRSGDW